MMLKPAIKFIVLTLVAASFSVPAVAQWQWRDKDGNKVFSDRSPPADIREQDILRRPGGRPGQTAVEPPDKTSAGNSDTAVATAAKPVVPKLPVKDAQLEAKKKAAEDEEAAKERVNDEKVAKAKSDNCDMARRYLTTLQSGARIVGTNAKGEREFMDDGKRATEKKRTEEVATSNCK